jgi:hypothetical protein
VLFVEEVDDTEFRLLIPNQELYKKYELDITGVHDYSNNEVDDIVNSGKFYGQSIYEDN